MESLFGIVLLWAAATGSPEATEVVKEIYPAQRMETTVKVAESRTEEVALTPNYSSGLGD
jgi:hypothetical protein